MTLLQTYNLPSYESNAQANNFLVISTAKSNQYRIAKWSVIQPTNHTAQSCNQSNPINHSSNQLIQLLSYPTNQSNSSVIWPTNRSVIQPNNQIAQYSNQSNASVIQPSNPITQSSNQPIQSLSHPTKQSNRSVIEPTNQINQSNRSINQATNQITQSSNQPIQSPNCITSRCARGMSWLGSMPPLGFWPTGWPSDHTLACNDLQGD